MQQPACTFLNTYLHIPGRPQRSTRTALSFQPRAARFEIPIFREPKHVFTKTPVYPRILPTHRVTKLKKSYAWTFVVWPLFWQDHGYRDGRLPSRGHPRRYQRQPHGVRNPDVQAPGGDRSRRVRRRCVVCNVRSVTCNVPVPFLFYSILRVYIYICIYFALLC